MYLLTVYIKRLDFWSGFFEQTTSTIFFSNSRSLEQPGLIIETLEYVLGFTGAYIAAARKIKIYDACTIISAF